MNIHEELVMFCLPIPCIEMQLFHIIYNFAICHRTENAQMAKMFTFTLSLHLESLELFVNILIRIHKLLHFPRFIDILMTVNFCIY